MMRTELKQELAHICNRLWAAENVNENESAQIESLLKQALAVLGAVNEEEFSSAPDG